MTDTRYDRFQVEEWFDDARRAGASHLIVMHHEQLPGADYPVLVLGGDDPETMVGFLNDKDHQHVSEVYALHLPKAAQLAEPRPYHLERRDPMTSLPHTYGDLTFEQVTAETDVDVLCDWADQCLIDPAEPEQCPACLAYVQAAKIDQEAYQTSTPVDIDALLRDRVTQIDVEQTRSRLAELTHEQLLARALGTRISLARVTMAGMEYANFLAGVIHHLDQAQRSYIDEVAAALQEGKDVEAGKPASNCLDPNCPDCSATPPTVPTS